MSDIDDMRFDLYCEIEMLEKENQQLKARLEKAEEVIRLYAEWESDFWVDELLNFKKARKYFKEKAGEE